MTFQWPALTHPCSACGIRSISRGSVPECRRAARARLCIACYRDARREARRAQVEKRGTCCQCGTHAIAAGRGVVSGYARRAKMCGRCYTTRGATCDT